MHSPTKTALITGVTGQDGSYLAELLLEKGYIVHGIKRRTSLINTERVDHIFDHPNFHMHYGDLSDSLSVVSLIQKTQPDEIYNLGAMSHVQVSFELPEYTANVDGLGTLRVLEAVRLLGMTEKTRIYQASTSELYGLVQEVPQRESTPFYPRSPYGVAKLYGYWITVNYREAYGMYACNGVLFNHESPRRGETFVTRKITRAVASIVKGRQQLLRLGNLEARRDWGHARDYVEAMWLMLQQDKPVDLVISTGLTTSVRDFVDMAFGAAGVSLDWSDHSATVRDGGATGLPAGKKVVTTDKRYLRPAEVELLIGDSSKAREVLGWQPKTDLPTLVHEMVQADLQAAEKHTKASNFS